MSVTASTKCWEGDYRFVLTVAGLGQLFDEIADSCVRQVVINRVQDRAEANRLASQLVEDGHLTRYAFAEDIWPEVADALEIPHTWFGKAWPYSAPELCELHLAETEFLLHLAGDVRVVSPARAWLPRAVALLEVHQEIATVSPTTPSRAEVAGSSSRGLGSEWVATQDFSDQIFLCRPAELLSPSLVRSTHPRVGMYPRPGGGLTFEARVCAWMRARNRWRATDLTTGYLHPVAGVEGDSYVQAVRHPSLLARVPEAGPDYPPRASAPITGVIVARNRERTIGYSVSSLSWCSRVVVLDQMSEDRTADVAIASGATVEGMLDSQPEMGPVAAALGVAHGGWVFLLEGDELVPPELAHHVVGLIDDEDVSALEVARQTMLFGDWARGAGYWPDYQLRVVRTEHLVEPAADADVLNLLPGRQSRRVAAQPQLSLLRFGSPGIEDWVRDRNASTSARAEGKSFDKRVSVRHAALTFLACFFRQGAWRMGRRGMRLAALEGLETWLYVEKAVEAARGGETEVLARYDEMAANVLAGRGTLRRS